MARGNKCQGLQLGETITAAEEVSSLCHGEPLKSFHTSPSAATGGSAGGGGVCLFVLILMTLSSCNTRTYRFWFGYLPRVPSCGSAPTEVLALFRSSSSGWLSLGWQNYCSYRERNFVFSGRQIRRNSKITVNTEYSVAAIEYWLKGVRNEWTFSQAENIIPCCLIFIRFRLVSAFLLLF